MPGLRTHYAKHLAPLTSTWLVLSAAQGNIRHYISGYEHSNFSSHFLTAFKKDRTQNAMQGVCHPLCQPTEQASKIVALKCLHSYCMDALFGPPQLQPAAGKWCIDCGSVQRPYLPREVTTLTGT